MDITPEQARAELARRELANRGSPSSSNSTAIPDISPAQARQELARREELKRDYPVRRALMNYVGRPVIEGGAMTVGGLAGTAMTGGNPLAGVALGAAMYPPAHQFANELEQALGIGGRRKSAGTLPEQALNAAKQFQAGAEIETGGKILGSAMTKGADALVRSGVPTLLGPSKEAVIARMERPGVIKNAPSYLQQAEKLPVTLKNMGKVIDSLYQRAAGTLRSSPEAGDGAVPLSFVNKMIGQLQEDLKVGESTVGAADQAATGKLGSLISDMNSIVKQTKMPEIVGPNGQVLNLQPKEVYLPETTVHKLIQRIRKNIDFTDKSASSTNSVLTDVSGQLDLGLKTGNKTYAAAIKPVAKLTQLQNDAIDTFGLTKRTGEGLAPTDATISSLKSLPTERRGVSQGLAKRLKAATREDLVGTSKNRQLAEQFSGSNTNGGRRAVTGAAIGNAVGTGLGYGVGHPIAGGSIGTTLGGIAGMATDTSGREMAGSVIDAYVRAKPWLAKLPYEIVTRLVSSGVLGRDEPK